MTVTRHVLAMGGEDWSAPGGSGLDHYLLGLSDRARPRVLLVPTATGDAGGTIAGFYRAFPSSRCEPSHLSLYRRDRTPLEELVAAADIVFVTGGSTVNLLSVWRAHGLDTVLRGAADRGAVLAGFSAGALCWFEGGVTDSFGPQLSGLRDGLGMVKGSFCPHYRNESRRRARYLELVAEGFPEGIGADDLVGLHFVDGVLQQVVAGRDGAGAVRVRRQDGGAIEEPLDVVCP